MNMALKAKRIADDLREYGVKFPVPATIALKYRGVGPRTVDVWFNMGLVTTPLPTPSPTDIKIEALKKSLIFHEAHVQSIRDRLRELERKNG